MLEGHVKMSDSQLFGKIIDSPALYEVWVDMVTFPGAYADELFSNEQNLTEIALIRSAVSISIERHGSQIIALVGHYDCAGNPDDREHHNNYIRNAM